jgi:hypothetical protein
MHQFRRVQLAKKLFAVRLSAAKRGRDTRAHIARLHAAARSFQSAWCGYVYRQVRDIRGVAKGIIVGMVRYWRARRFRRRALAAIPRLQAVGRMWIARRKYVALRRAVTVLAACWRRRKPRARFAAMRAAATRVGTWWRCVSRRRAYRCMRAAAVQVQRVARGHLARRLLRRSVRAATAIAATWKMVWPCRGYRLLVWNITRFQAAYRGYCWKVCVHVFVCLFVMTLILHSLPDPMTTVVVIMVVTALLVSEAPMSPLGLYV